MKMKQTPKEWDQIRRIQNIVHRNKPKTLVPLGDDCFVTSAPDLNLVMCQDMMIEDVHFSLSYFSAADLGYKSLAVNLSDFAAMGASPKWAQVSLAIPEKLNNSWLDEFYSSMSLLADQHGVEIVGGDLCASPKTLVIDVSLIGEVKTPLTRKGSRLDDVLLCSGPLGFSSMGLELLANKKNMQSENKDCLLMNQIYIDKHLRPQPRMDLVKQLSPHAEQIHALIDVSDGLVSECLHLINNTPLGIHLDSDSLDSFFESATEETFHSSLWGGEDYELLMSVSPEVYENAQPTWLQNWHKIGTFNHSNEISYSGKRTLHLENKKFVLDSFKGWKHF